ncbi:MAG: hypothetical protein JO345_06810 [Streptosporangiaceae bacterium]|nr:hypothetical protein [Streptosporangiaceae bacterium]
MNAACVVVFSAGQHQAAERDAEDDLAAGRFRTFGDAEGFLADLESLAADPGQ